jgi:hypothetical protein
MNATGAGAFADSRSDSFGQVRIPGRCQANTCGVDRGRKTGVRADSDGTIRHLEGRQVQPGHSAYGEAGAADVVNLLFQRHLLDQRRNFFVGGIGGLREELA